MSVTLRRDDGRGSVALPRDVSALLLKSYPNAASELRAVSSHANEKVIPTDVLLFGQSTADGPLVPQTELRTSTHIWHLAAGLNILYAVFVGQPLRGNLPLYQMTTPSADAKAEQQRKAGFDKKQAQLKEALASNKIAYEEAKQTGELSDVGALAIERDRIKQELAIPFVPRRVSRSVDEVSIAPLSVKMQFGYFKHPETGLLFALVNTAKSERADFTPIRPIMCVNNTWSA